MLTASVSARAGGVASVVCDLARSLDGAGVGVEVFAADSDPSEARPGALGDVPLHLQPLRGPGRFGYQAGLGPALGRAGLDILHVHGLWMYPSLAAARWSNGAKVISPHGMLDPWATRNSRLKKVIAGALYERRNLRGAACIHALSPAEAAAIRSYGGEYGLTLPIAIIPNGIDLPDAAQAPAKPGWAALLPPGARVLLFLGRIHPKKGLAPLIAAMADAADPALGQWHLVVAGWDDGGHLAELAEQARALGVDDKVHFVGAQFGADKAASFAAADAFVLPSLSEGLPMAVLEAWSFAKPVVMTAECNLPEGFAAEAAIRVAADPAAIGQGLRQLARMSDEDRRAIGANGRRLVAERFNWPRIARDMQELYTWILGGGDAPGFVKPAHG